MARVVGLIPALHAHREFFGLFHYVRCFHDHFGRACFIVYVVGVEKVLERKAFDGEVHILRDIANKFGHFHSIQLGHYDADNVAAFIEQRSTAVARLYRRRDL